MPFFILVAACIAVWLFFRLTTPSERANIQLWFWIILLGLGAVAFARQLIVTGTLQA